jgi:hypothetical protein
MWLGQLDGLSSRAVQASYYSKKDMQSVDYDEKTQHRQTKKLSRWLCAHNSFIRTNIISVINTIPGALIIPLIMMIRR